MINYRLSIYKELIMKSDHVNAIQAQIKSILAQNNIAGTPAEQQIIDTINAALSSDDVVNSRDEDKRDKEIASLKQRLQEAEVKLSRNEGDAEQFKARVKKQPAQDNAVPVGADKKDD